MLGEREKTLELIQLKSINNYLSMKNIKKLTNNRIIQVFNTYLIDSLEELVIFGCKNVITRKGKILNTRDLNKRNKIYKLINKYEKNYIDFKRL